MSKCNSVKTIGPDTKKKARFYEFVQNNSGGSFYGHYIVIVEAADAENANRIAEGLGVYFDGVSGGQDCSCCGDRWSKQWDDKNGTETPMHYGTPIADAVLTWGTALVQYLDGTKKIYSPSPRNK